MDIIIVCHTELGYVRKKRVIPTKDPAGVEKGVPALIEVADKYQAKVSFALSPEAVPYFPKGVSHEIGFHLHPGWVEVKEGRSARYSGDSYLRDRVKLSLNSLYLCDYPYEDQLALIQEGKACLKSHLTIEPKVFVAGLWASNANTGRALVEAGFTHDASACPGHPRNHWDRLPRISAPYRPSHEDYQRRGDLPLLILPASQFFPRGDVSPEQAPVVGVAWLKAAFREYYEQGWPYFHIALHSPSMSDAYFVEVMEDLLKFISRHQVEFKFASEIREYGELKPRTRIWPYLRAFWGPFYGLKWAIQGRLGL